MGIVTLFYFFLTASGDDQKMRICFYNVNQEFPNSKLNPRRERFSYWLGWLFVVVVDVFFPGLVGIDVRLVCF